MAVLKAKPEKFINYLFPLLRRELVLPLLVTRVNGDDFKGALGDTLTMRVGELRTVARKYEWRTRSAPIVLDDIEGGGGIPITFGTHAYSATGLTDEHFTMDDIDLVREVVGPQTQAVARDLESDVVTAYNALATREEVDFDENSTSGAADPYKVAIRAQAALNRQKRAPKDGRVWLVGANVEQAILESERLSDYSKSGNTLVPGALSDATIGQIGGLRVVSSAEFDDDFSVVTHKSSLVLGTVRPAVPRGVSFSAGASADGFAMRWLMDYDANFLRDRSIVSMFSGVTEVYDEVFLSGDRVGELKTPEDYTGGAVPKSARAVKVNFTEKTAA